MRKVVVDGRFAARLDDLNGDFREICLTIFKPAGSKWDELGYADDAGFPQVGETTAYGWANGFAFVVGRAHPGARVRVFMEDQPHMVLADHEGWWLHARTAEAPSHPISDPHLRVETE